jgi:quercetin dioxygenase-like cupin family protein
MEDMNRRSAMTFGLTVAAATPLVTLGTPAVAAMYGPDEGKEYHPGVRIVMLGKRDSMIPAYKQVQLSDTVFQPGSTWPDESMPNDMVCTVIEGELRSPKETRNSRVRVAMYIAAGKARTKLLPTKAP